MWRMRTSSKKLPRSRCITPAPRHLAPQAMSAPEEQSAIATAAEEFNIPAARRNRIVVTKVSERD